MKRLTTVLMVTTILVALSTAAMAAPDEIHTQGVLRDAEGA